MPLNLKHVSFPAISGTVVVFVVCSNVLCDKKICLCNIFFDFYSLISLEMALFGIQSFL